MTLIELMVALTVGLLLALAVTTVIAVTLRQQKVSASVGERDQAGTYAMAQLDKYIRSAGSGFSNTSALGMLGCTLHAGKGSTTLLPAASLAAPFASVSSLKAPLAAPVLVEKGVGANGSDVLFVMAAHGAAADVPRAVLPAGSAVPTLAFNNVIDLAPKDLVLVAASGQSDCYVSQINTTASTSATVVLGGAYYAASQVTAVQAIVDSKDAYLAALGNSTGGYPMARLFGVGSGDALYQYDVLQLSGSAVGTIAEDVSHLFALYGVDTDKDGKVDAWVSPGAAGWTVADLKAASSKINQILAIRVAVVTHSHGVKQAGISPATLYAFEDLGSLKQTITLTSAQRADRFKVTESIIPLRNNLLVQ
ncbi:type IV pilus assembly protein PilW [Comamonas odontotermitis]|uniref:Type IV pilus assembly protein PilW n=2 Tax=Comamonas odontotermitis TaxID=379895 RepID=A0ABR6RM13_9BURK|nr:type IV pilus assembly protein PilW [Comamonas odontotermitis]